LEPAELTVSMPASNALPTDLEGTAKADASERHARMLRQMTDLFLSDAERLNENQIGVFDEVLACLIERMEAQTLAQLSISLADTNFAPRKVVRQLAHHQEATVATPVLAKSNRLSDAALLEIAATRGQHHLLAISGRPGLNEPLTDVLLERGDNKVSHALVANSGARFSEAGYSSLIERAGKDEQLAEKLGVRPDMPADKRQELMSKASAFVQKRLLKTAPPEIRVKIQQAIQAVAKQIEAEAPKPVVDYREAETRVVALNRAGKLGDQTINRFAVEERHVDIIAALALLATVEIKTIEPLLGNPQPDGLIVACKASRLDWSTTAMVLRCRPNCPPLAKPELKQARELFDSLSLSAAQNTIRFWSAQGSAGKAPVPETATAVPEIRA
jgi:uncharacterized protein (DUF2336 family)